MRSFLSKFIASALSLASLSAIAPAEYIMRNDMFDFDQKRSVIPNDGKMHCVPTSYMDLFMYMSTHGLPLMDGGYNANSYSDMSGFELTLGILMGTSSTGGTNQPTAYDVANSWMFGHTSKLILPYFFGGGSDWSWRTIRNYLRLGSICRIGYGRYYRANNVWVRDSGHSVALAGFQDDGAGNQTFYVADPSSSDSLNSQSPFVIKDKSTDDITFTTQNHGVVTHARYTHGTGDNGNWRYVIDSMHAILPQFAGWQATTRASSRLHLEIPFQMNEATHQWPSTLDITVPDTVVDWSFDMRTGGIVYLNSTGLIYELDLDGVRTQIANIPNAKQIVVGGETQDLFVLIDNLLIDQLQFVNRNGGLGVIKSLGGNVASIDYDPVHQGPVVVANNLNKISLYSHSLGTKTDVPLTRILPWKKDYNYIQAGTGIVKVDHSNGDYIVAKTGDDHWERFQWVNGNLVGKPVYYRGTSGITTLCPAENGVMFVQDGNNLLTLGRSGSPIATDFSGMNVQTSVRIPRSEFAANRAEFSTMEWQDVEPDGVWP
ncbi:MAG: hypothetical protein JSS66_01730 [Armatimonadetes bacterium]|nr:hypothetical protein [Armatimonadota bacterium]